MHTVLKRPTTYLADARWRDCHNRPSPSCFEPHYESEAKYKELVLFACELMYFPLVLGTSSVVSNAANSDTGPRTVDPCSGREATSPLATMLALESPTTSRPQANQLNRSNEDDLAQVDQITQNYELESGRSLGVKGNLKNNLGFWRSIGAPDFILSIIENGYRLPFISFPLPVKLRNNKSARLHAAFVDQAVLELVNSGRVRWLKNSL